MSLLLGDWNKRRIFTLGGILILISMVHLTTSTENQDIKSTTPKVKISNSTTPLEKNPKEQLAEDEQREAQQEKRSIQETSTGHNQRAESKADLHIRLIIKDPPKLNHKPNRLPSFHPIKTQFPLHVTRLHQLNYSGNKKKKSYPHIFASNHLSLVNNHHFQQPSFSYPLSALILESDFNKLQHSTNNYKNTHPSITPLLDVELPATKVEWLNTKHPPTKLIVQPDIDTKHKEHSDYKGYVLKEENIKPVVEHIEGDIQYDFRTKKHMI